MTNPSSLPWVSLTDLAAGRSCSKRALACYKGLLLPQFAEVFGTEAGGGVSRREGMILPRSAPRSKSRQGDNLTGSRWNCFGPSSFMARREGTYRASENDGDHRIGTRRLPRFATRENQFEIPQNQSESEGNTHEGA